MLLISGIQAKNDRYTPNIQAVELAGLQQSLLERLAEICDKEGMAVLELEDTGDVFIAEGNEDGSTVLWKLVR